MSPHAPRRVANREGDHLAQFLDGQVACCQQRWTTDLGAVDITFSGRLTRSLGLCTPARGSIRLASWLAAAPPELLAEVVVHELAHVAARTLHGAVAPHGPEWRRLMVTAGLPARATVPESMVAPHRPPREEPAVLHRCARCGAERVARRRVPQWRCVACRARGRSGALEIIRLPPRTARA